MLKNCTGIVLKGCKSVGTNKRGFSILGNMLRTRIDPESNSSSKIYEDFPSENILKTVMNKPDSELQRELPTDEIFYGASHTWRDFVDKGIIGSLADEITEK